MASNQFDQAPKITPNYLSADEELARLAGDIATTIFHLVGTAKTGAKDDAMTVLNADQTAVNSLGDLKNGLITCTVS
jgi:choline dehydrogenase-like flavoprotein